MHRILSPAIPCFILFCVALQIGCSGSNSADGKYRVAVIPKGETHVFWKSVHAGAQQAADELGNVDIQWKGPPEEDSTSDQIGVVKNMVVRQVDAICLAPNDASALVGTVKECNEKDIPVIVFDSGLAEGADYVSYVATDNFVGGEKAAERLAAAMGGEGDVIMLRYKRGSESTEQREEGFLAKLKSDYPDITVISSDLYAGTKTSEALEVATQVLVKYQDSVDGIFAVCEPNANGVLEALEKTKLAGKVKFVAFDPSDRLIAAMQKDKVHGIVLQDPFKMGYLSVKTAVAELENRKKDDGKTVIEKRISTGEYVATPENMEEEKYKKLLSPLKYGE
jgi:ribose transport system substrate-binding protein